jgi:hypothetical protein
VAIKWPGWRALSAAVAIGWVLGFSATYLLSAAVVLTYALLH